MSAADFDCPAPEARPSPNHNERRGQPIDLLLLHYTGMPTAEAALQRLCDPAAEVSAHYLVEEDGRLWQLVPEERRAWHAGRSCWAGAEDVNARSLGIEIVNPGHQFGYRPFPAAQLAVVTALCRQLLARWHIPQGRVLGHSDVAPLRKLDPGELFPWAALAAAGVGLWPPALSPLPPDEARARRDLARFGYGYLEEDWPAVLRALQRHFRPACVDGRLDGETAAIAAWLAAQVDSAP